MLFDHPFDTYPFSEAGQQRRGYFDFDISVESLFTLVIYVATQQFATEPDDTPPSQPFRGVLQSYSFTRSILGQRIGVFVNGTGKLVINNIDAHYDFLPQFYTPDAQPIVLRILRQGDPYGTAAFPFAYLTSTGWDVSARSIDVDLIDYAYKLEVPMQPNLYGGTGGADGGVDLAGKHIPLCFGTARNVPAVPLSPGVANTYQVHDGAVEDVVAVFDRGIALTKGADYATYALLAAATIAAGYYATCLAQGYFRTGVTPDGTVTADVKGENTGGFIVTSADIVRWAIGNRTELVDPDDLAEATFDQLNTDQPAPIDYWLGPDDSISVANFIANVMGGIGGWGGFRRDGLFHVVMFAAPTGDPVDAFSVNDILEEDIERQQLPDAYKPPPWRWRVPYARSWTVQTDLVGAVTAAQKAFVKEQYRLAQAENDQIKVDYRFAQDPDPVQAFFSEEADAEAEATRLLNLFRATRRLYSASLPRRALRRDLGDVIRLTHPRFDLSQGKLMTIVQIAEQFDFETGQMLAVKVTAYG